MANLQSTNVTGTLCVNGIAIGGGKDFQYCCFTGSTTWTPSSDLVSGDGVIKAHLVGAGGGGGGSWGWALAQTSYTCPIRTLQGCPNPGNHGAAGGFVERNKFITSTDTCTITIGAGGTGGVATGDATCTSITTVCDSLAISTNSTDGGNTVFGGFTAYGGCGGKSCANSRRAHGCQGAQSYIAEDTPTLTNSGNNGAFNLYLECNVFMGGCNCNHGCIGVMGSANCGTGSNTEIAIQCSKNISCVGVEGVSSCRRCGVFANTSFDGNMTVSANQNGARTSQTYGNGGVRGSATYAPNSTGTPLVYEGSGSQGNDGIVVLQWME